MSKKITNFALANRKGHALIIGEVPEWSIGAVSKTVVPLRVPRVRIPASPQSESCKFKTCSFSSYNKLNDMCLWCF